MKMLRIGDQGQERPAAIDEQGHIRDLSSLVDDIQPSSLSPESIARLQQVDLTTLPKIDPSKRIGACISNVGKLVCIGLNYSDHAEEAGMAIPNEPIVFMKATSAICGPYDVLEIPKGSTKTDWEVELGVVIGSSAKYITEDEVDLYIAGYCVANDLSEREFQLERLGSWDKGKSHDTFAPLGPYLVTKDEICDPQNLALWTKVNGNRVQSGNTATMVFSLKQIIAYLSRFMTLEPGDVILTGTPPGVGMGHKPATYLSDGDIVEVGISDLGEQRQVCQQV